MEVLIALPFVAYVGERLAEKLIKPLIKGISSGVLDWLGEKIGEESAQNIADYVESIVCAIPGFVLSLLAGLDLFAAVGLPLAGYGGLGATALIVGFGANLVHDLLGYLDALRLDTLRSAIG